jgi:hypothetical protein
VLVLWTWNHHVLSIYYLSTGGFVPSDKGKGRAVEAMDEGKSESDRAVSLTVSEYESAFHGGSSAFVYDWIDDAHGDSDPEDPGESVEDWLTDRSYMDASEDPIV